MRKLFSLISITFLIMTVIMACNKDENEDVTQQLSDEQITLNLLEFNKGELNLDLLYGEWDVIKFAYTANGNEIMDVAEKPYTGRFSISDYINELGIPTWGFGCISSFRVEYSVSSPNLIRLSLYQTDYLLVNSPEQDAIVEALNNAYSFIVKDDELIIYFTGDKNKNLLIFKKHEL